MTYERPEVLEVGAAAEVILGAKDDLNWSDLEFQRTISFALDEMPEALEVGAAAEVILGAKDDLLQTDHEFQRTIGLAVDEIE